MHGLKKLDFSIKNLVFILQKLVPYLVIISWIKWEVTQDPHQDSDPDLEPKYSEKFGYESGSEKTFRIVNTDLWAAYA